MKKIEVEKFYKDNDRCLAIYATDPLKFPDNNDKREFNEPLSSSIEKWPFSNIDKTFNTLLATLICKNEKDKKRDLENLLFYNLNRRFFLNPLIAKSKRIIFQCLEGANYKENDKFMYIYFYRLFNSDNEELNNYLLCKINDLHLVGEIEVNTITELLFAQKDKKQELLTKVQNSKHNYSNKINKIRKGTNFALKIQIPDNLSIFICSIENLKIFIDCIVFYLNSLSIIEHKNPDKLVSEDGRYNPSDQYLYFCDIEKVDSMDSYIKIFLCPIRSEHNKEKSCCTPKESLNNLLRFLGILGDKKKT